MTKEELVMKHREWLEREFSLGKEVTNIPNLKEYIVSNSRFLFEDEKIIITKDEFETIKKIVDCKLYKSIYGEL